MPAYTPSDLIILTVAGLGVLALFIYHVIECRRKARASMTWRDHLARMPKHDPSQRASKARDDVEQWLDSFN